MTVDQAVMRNDMTGRPSGTLRSFLKEPSQPVYYKMKAYLTLSAAEEENEPWENIAACRYFLKEAKRALEESQRTYVSCEGDAETLKGYERIIQEELDQLHLREKLMNSDDEHD
jgi:endo-1,4-beta-D-glucanase Y